MSTTRRSFLKQTAIASAILSFSPLAAFAAEQTAPKGPFTVPALPYAYDALVPVIDAETMKLHHDKHHQAYVDKLNGEIAKDKKLAGKTIEQILANAHTYNDTVRNNAGGHWNHSFFWSLMAPPSQVGQPSAELAKAITDKFGSLDKFKEEFEKSGVGQFGSGWVWLVINKKGDLEITTTANQDNPLMGNTKVKGEPILGNDLWEHAYYLTYRNKRADYLKNWWKVVNWKQVSDNFAAAVK